MTGSTVAKVESLPIDRLLPIYVYIYVYIYTHVYIHLLNTHTYVYIYIIYTARPSCFKILGLQPEMAGLSEIPFS